MKMFCLDTFMPLSIGKKYSKEELFPFAQRLFS